MADDLVQRLRDRLAAGCNYMEDGSVMPDAETRITRAEIDEIERLRTIAGLARKARWIGAACWDLADGSGCFISAESMKRFDEVFNELGVALGDTVPLDEEDERAQFDGPAKLLERAKAAEAERDALRKRIETAPSFVCGGNRSYIHDDYLPTGTRVRVLIEKEQS